MTVWLVTSDLRTAAAALDVESCYVSSIVGCEFRLTVMEQGSQMKDIEAYRSFNSFHLVGIMHSMKHVVFCQ
jgi:hypothetical protein